MYIDGTLYDSGEMRGLFICHLITQYSGRTCALYEHFFLFYCVSIRIHIPAHNAQHTHTHILSLSSLSAEVWRRVIQVSLIFMFRQHLSNSNSYLTDIFIPSVLCLWVSCISVKLKNKQRDNTPRQHYACLVWYLFTHGTLGSYAVSLTPSGSCCFRSSTHCWSLL